MKPLKQSARPKIKATLRKLVRRHGPILGILTPAIVEEARSPKSPLHKEFTWDDTLAGEKWRLHEARHLVQTFLIEEEGPLKGQREWTSVLVMTEEEPETLEHLYVDTNSVMADPELRRQQVERGISEIQAWVFRYRHFSELGRICNAIIVAMAVRAKG